jgi:hypothetical protein
LSDFCAQPPSIIAVAIVLLAVRISAATKGYFLEMEWSSGSSGIWVEN